MKKIFFKPLMALAMMLVGVSFTSCNDDNKEVLTPLTNKTIIGTWENFSQKANLTYTNGKEKKAYMVTWTFENGQPKGITVDNKPIEKADKKVQDFLKTAKVQAKRIELQEKNKATSYKHDGKAWVSEEKDIEYTFNEKNGDLNTKFKTQQPWAGKVTGTKDLMLLNLKSMEGYKEFSFSDIIMSFKRIAAPKK